MSSRIEQIIEEIEEYVDSCKFQPLSSTKIVVNKEELEELLRELRMKTPDEIKRYQKIISNKDAILADAQSKADAIIADAKTQAQQMVTESEVMQQAYAQSNELLENTNQQAQEIMDNATTDANNIRMGALQYTDEMLANLEKIMSHTIDAAKAMWIKYEYPDITFEDMCKVFGIPSLRNKAHFCAISSTSGTATEVTAFAVITDYEKGIKYPLADFEITPDVAIVDPDLAETMPQKLVAHTGMDAMTHAIEAYVSTANCDFTDPLALYAIKMIQADLVDSYNGDMAKRDSMHNAQCLAGMAFSNALLGIVHSMAHKTGAAFADYGAHLIHGAANAMYLPKVIAFNAKDETAAKRYAVIADEMKLGGETTEEKVKLLIDYLRGMNDKLNIPHCIKNYGKDSYPTEQGFVPEDVFLDRLHDIAVNAIADACTGSNPRQPSVEEMEKLLKCCYYDTEVDF